MVFANGDLLLFKAVMDNRLAWLLEKHSEGVSKKVGLMQQAHAAMSTCSTLLITKEHNVLTEPRIQPVFLPAHELAQRCCVVALPHMLMHTASHPLCPPHQCKPCEGGTGRHWQAGTTPSVHTAADAQLAHRSMSAWR